MGRHNTSGYVGACWNKRERKWTAHIRADGKQVYLGSFDTPEAASARYLKAKAELHPFQPVPRALGSAEAES